MNTALTIFILVLILGSSDATNPCFSNFYTNSAAYEICKEKPCFLMLYEAPYVFSTIRLMEEPALPFACNKIQRKNKHRGLKGLFFDIVDGISSIQEESGNATEFMCIYESSPKCSFDNTIRFMQEAAMSNSTGHQFIAGGYFIFLPHRRTTHTVQSAPWVSADTVLLYRRDWSLNSFGNAQKSIVLPFNWDAWVVVALFLILIFIGFFIYILNFLPCREFIPAMYWIFVGERNVVHGNDDVFELVAWETLKLSLKVLATVLILLYEIAVAFFIFRGSPPLINDIKQLQSLEVEQIAVWKEAAQETILARYVDIDGQYIGLNATKPPPWHRYNSQFEMIELLMNGKVKYVLTFDDILRYFLYQQRLCGKVSTAGLRKKELGGWYYSSALSKNVTDSFDKALLELHLDRTSILGETKYGEKSLDCGDAEQNVDGKVMSLLLMYTIVPILLIFGLFFAGAKFIKHLREHQQEHAD